jgi:hypothetical protein
MSVKGVVRLAIALASFLRVTHCAVVKVSPKATPKYVGFKGDMLNHHGQLQKKNPPI